MKRFMKRFLFMIAAVLLSTLPVFAQQEVVAKYRANYTAPLAPSELLALLTDVARELNQQQPIYGLLRKPTGHNCGGYSCDIVCTIEQPMRQFDVLGNLPDVGSPEWNQVPPEKVNVQGGCEYVSPAVTPHPPQPDPICPACPPDQRELVEALEHLLAVAREDVLSLMAERDALLNRPAPTCEAKLWGIFTVPCKVVQR